ncbi:NAD-dependent epimerase/dehydratase family protein [Enterobacter sp. HSTU-ASh6]|uniref:NAD-dependent epimerase/dehydratase family protein n=1 Tax=Enterobacter sp. HSTU-ASh6 TaxID=2678687 RepID=UPI0022599A65|nr:NAD-dependent epimerase/dehydratase family protein [Enterobacter sp. HSTU-ASh6]MCX4181966.1 NAD-dependent epimerase/dehydratase family protein [Enterobacter sp. HSTU-ASh6]
MKGINIMILGAGGFIGSHLSISFLERGATVHAFGRSLDTLKLGSKNLIKYESTNIDNQILQKIDSPDYIYFLIGSASVARSIKAPLEDFEQSIPPLLLVLEKLRTSWKESKLIFVSSAAVYGTSANDRTSIKSSLNPVSPYGLNKKISEEYIHYYCEHYSIDAKIIRPFSVYGPQLKKQLIWDVLNKMQRGEHHFFGSGDELRDWIYINDFIKILNNYVSEYNSMDNVVNIGSGNAVSVKKIVSMLYKITNTNASPLFVDGGKEGDPKHLVSDISEQNCLKPFLNTSLEEGLIETVNWFNKFKEEGC